MAITYADVTGTITQPGSSIGVHATVTAIPNTEGYVLSFSGAGGGNSMGPQSVTTDPATGYFTLTLPTNSDQQASLLWRIIVKRLDNVPGVPQTWNPGNFAVTEDVDFDVLAPVEVSAVSETILTDLATLVADAEAAAAAAQAVGTTNDAVIAGRVNDAASATRAALSATLVPRPEIANGDLAPLQDPIYSTPTTAIAIGTIDGVTYGAQLAGDGLYRSTDDGATWTLVHAFTGAGGPVGIAIMGNGEAFVVCPGGAYRSTGWATNPLTATWTLAASPTGALDGYAAATFIHSTWDVSGQYVLLSEYINPKHNSRKVMLSTNYGATFTTVWDKATVMPANVDIVHIHAVAIDPFKTGNPRLWFTHGDGVSGVYYSDNLGSSWTAFTAGGTTGWVAASQNMMTITATPAGMVLTTDSNAPDGVYRILRTSNPANMVLERMLHIPYPAASGSLLGFGVKSWRDPATNLVWMTFNASRPALAGSPSIPGYVFVSDGKRAAIAWTTPEVSAAGTSDSVITEGIGVTASGKVIVSYRAGSPSTYVQALLTPGGRGTKPYGETNGGNALTGYAQTRDSVAIGPYTVAKGQSVVIGSKAVTTDTSGVVPSAVSIGDQTNAGTNGTVVGFQAAGAQTRATAVGSTASVTGADGTAVGASATAADLSTAIGKGAVATSGNTAIGQAATTAAGGSTVIGRGATATNANNLAIGYLASVSNSGALAIGQGANSGGTDNIAIGRAANTTTWQRCVVVGAGLTSTASDQVLFGNKHVEITELAADPAAGATNSARWYVKDNGSGKTQLCVRFATGAVQILATEP